MERPGGNSSERDGSLMLRSTGTDFSMSFWLPALLGLALPVFAGVLWMGLAGAPTHYLLVNFASLALALAWIALGRMPQRAISRRMLTVALLALLFVPLVTGPFQVAVGGHPVARWLPTGPFSINAGMLVLPSLTVLAARDREYASPILFTALLAASLQPDAALAFAITFAAVGLHHITRNWRIGLVAIVGFFVAMIAAVKGELPPVRFVERVFFDAAETSVLVALLLGAILVASFLALLRCGPQSADQRYALAGALFGFSIAALMSHYPTPLIGYGAAPILGFGLALGFARPSADQTLSG